MVLSPHVHTGRKLPHRHTSYYGLALLLLLVGVILAGITGITMAQQVSVSAVVLGPKPTKAPVITLPVSQQHFLTNPIDIKGTCDAGLLVNVYKNDVLAGAALCDASGRFSMKADLFIGRNDLVAHMIDQANQEGPDSSPVVVFFDLPSTPSIVDQGASAGSKGNVIIKAESIYKGTTPGQELSWQIAVEGGSAPYAISIEWGDGQTELISRSAAGSFAISHTYSKAGGYKGGYVVTVTAVDTEGTTATMQLVAVVNNPVGTPLAVTQIKPPTNWSSLLIAWPLWIVLVLMLISYWLGERRQRQLDDQRPAIPLPQIPAAII